VTGENRDQKSEFQVIAEATAEMNQIINHARELAVKLKETSDALNRIADEENE
jgi:hypothetical protein